MSTAAENQPDITYRHCESDADYAACIALQQSTWGDDDVVPTNLLKAAGKIGGIVAGAFDASGRMLGCVFGMSGVREGRPTHWSHMLAVIPEARGQGVGYGLKIFQRDELMATGFDHMYWTYDPLEAINAHFNINRLGARPVEYVEDMYGEGETNLLHQGLGTDRFIIEWTFSQRAASPETPQRAPVINQFLDRKGNVEDSDAPRCVRVEVPRNVQELKEDRPEEARLWRISTRDAFQRCLQMGYSITGFELGDRSYYLLELDV